MSNLKTLKTICIAVALSFGLAACGGGGGSSNQAEPIPMPMPDPALGAAQMAAATAAGMAGDAATDAEQAVMDQDGNQAADPASYAVAQNAATRARAAANAAQAASDAAAATMDTAAAQAQQGIAERKQGEAETERDNADMYAGMVQTAQNALDAEAQRVMDVGTARSNAMLSYGEAEGDAEKAEMQADEAEATAPNSPGAISARQAATAARAAAILAKEAHDAITDGMTKDEADMQATEAAKQAMYANAGYMTAKRENNTIQTASIIGQEQLEARDLRMAKEDAEELYNDADDGVTFHYNAVVGKASDAAAQARAARAAATRASRARTDATETNKHAMAAETASSQAQAALGRARTAKANADMARQDAMDATESVDAKAALAALETANDALTAEHTGAMGAGMAYMRARDAAAEAAEAQGVHVISLLIHANAQDLTLRDPADVDLAASVKKARDDRYEAVGDQINMAVGMHGAAADQIGDRDQDSSTDDTDESGASVMASWVGRNVDNPTTDEDESTMPSLSITVTISTGNDLTFRTKAVEADPKTATRFDRGLGNFYGYRIEDSGNHAIVFTDKKQGPDQVLAVTAVTARYVEDEDVDTAAELKLGTDRTGPTFTGVTWTPSDQPPLTGTLNCADDGCDIQVNADGSIQSIDGYEFTGSRDAVAGVEAADAMQDDDYLAFGVWLREDANGETEGTPKTFAAFANGGEPIASFDDYVTLTGTATYRGSATGVYTEGSGVDYFEGDATLTANFGKPGTDDDADAADDEIGTISGSIHGIYVDGESTTDVISLREADIANTNTAFAGNVRMGPGTIEDDDSVSYKYNGTWSGNFYGPNAAVLDDPDTDADESMDAAGPDAVAGTFGVSGTEGEGDVAVTRSYVGAFGARR